MWRRVEFAKDLQISTWRSRISFSTSDCLLPFFIVNPCALGMRCICEIMVATMLSPFPGFQPVIQQGQVRARVVMRPFFRDAVLPLLFGSLCFVSLPFIDT